MNLRRLSLLALLLPILSFQAPAQVAVGQWRTHFSFAKADAVIRAGQLVYATANQKLFYYDPDDGEVGSIDALNGLHGNDVVCMGYHAGTATLLVVYRDGNMDFVGADGDIENLPDFRDKALSADKTVNRLRLYGDNAFVATGAGVLHIDMTRREISETYRPENASGQAVGVADFALLDGCYYLLTSENQLLTGRTDRNLLDNRYWEELPFVSWTSARHIVAWEGRLYAAAGRFVFCKTPTGNWESFRSYSQAVTSLNTDEGCLVTGLADSSFEVLQPESLPFASAQASFLLAGDDGTCLNGIALDSRHGRIFSASGSDGIAVWELSDSELSLSEKGFLPDGPTVNTAWKMLFHQGCLYVTSGGRWGDRYRYDGGVFGFDGEQWLSFTPEADDLEEATGYPFRDILNVAVDPADPGHLFATSWGEGLYEFRDGGLVQLHTIDNSPLVDCIHDNPYRYIRVDGATFDADGNLWVLNSDPTYGQGGIHLLTPQGRWLSAGYASMPGAAPSWDDILFRRNGEIWVNSERVTDGLFVIDPKGTLADFSDDDTRWISSFTDQDGKAVDVFAVHCATEDRSGNVWLGTNRGPLVVYSSVSLLDDATPVFSRVKVPRNDGTNEADYLLTNDHVLCIAVDGADRKWLGTESDGAYLLSADGITTVHHFTSDNSPLPSDNVCSIAIHPESGEVFFGTEAGIVSYRSDANEPADDYSAVRVFPNPVEPEWQGDIVVTGLMENSQVRITDLRGHAMAVGRSLGGQFVWNGLTPSGGRAATGVYLVFATDQEGASGQVGKIVFIH